ncbi:unnamed protein product [Trichobilharzia regenti]|nr:unnamed protein product [Trichobilharzia regenti]
MVCLKLNPSKCQTDNFSFRSERKLNDEAVGFYDRCKIDDDDDSDIEIKSEVKHLGLILSSDPSWSSHTS